MDLLFETNKRSISKNINESIIDNNTKNENNSITVLIKVKQTKNGANFNFIFKQQNGIIYIYIPPIYYNKEILPGESLSINLGYIFEVDDSFIQKKDKYGIFILIKSIKNNEIKVPFGMGGVIDIDYRNELILLLYNSSNTSQKLLSNIPYAKLKLVKFYKPRFITNLDEYIELKTIREKQKKNSNIMLGTKTLVYYNGLHTDPFNGTPGSAGYDITTKLPNNQGIYHLLNGVIEVFNTYSSVMFPEKIQLRCYSKSSTGGKKKIVILGEKYYYLNEPQEIIFRAMSFNGDDKKNNLIDKTNINIFRKDERHIQMVFIPDDPRKRYYKNIIFEFVDSLSETKRKGGFGSTNI